MTGGTGTVGAADIGDASAIAGTGPAGVASGGEPWERAPKGRMMSSIQIERRCFTSDRFTGAAAGVVAVSNE